MPNWCENDLRCSGKESDLRELLSFVKGKTDFDFSKIIPYHEHLQKLDDACEVLYKLSEKGLITYASIPESGYETLGFSWCVDHWGTKWNADEVRIEDKKLGEVTIHFNTAWAPPNPVIKELSFFFPSIKFILFYYECGQMFHGRATYIEGKCIEEIEKAYHGLRGG